MTPFITKENFSLLKEKLEAIKACPKFIVHLYGVTEDGRCRADVTALNGFNNLELMGLCEKFKDAVKEQIQKARESSGETG